MSGLLRRIKRSRSAGAGDTPAEEQATGTESATSTPTGDEAKTTELPVATPPAIAADPDRPAGLEEGAPVAPAVSGRRGRLRRRLRYLRRARELMLRDLGGLVYEVHRTGRGDFGTHSGVIAGKVERLSLLDAESGAIEHALGAPRSEAVIFEPGVGGTCDVCGELYGSAARFCSRCGTATDAAARETTAPAAETRHVPPMPKARGTGETAAIAPGEAAADEAGASRPAGAAAPAAATGGIRPAGEAEPAAPADEFTWTDVRPADASAAEKDAPAAAGEAERGDHTQPAAAAGEAERGDDTKSAAAAGEAERRDEMQPAAAEEAKPKRRARRPKAVEPPAADEPANEPAAGKPADEPMGEADPGRNPFANISNGRPDEEGKPPELSSGDPLAARESRE